MALKHLVLLHNASKSKRDRQRLVSAAGDVLHNEELGSARSAAADALGRLNDDRAAFKELRRALPSCKTTTVGPLGLRVINAVGYLAPDAGAGPLTELAEKSADPNAAIHAVRALGGYGYSKHRERIFKDLLKRAKARAPGRTRPGDKAGSAELRRLWQRLSGEVVTALNALTGQTVPDLAGWDKLVRQHKKNISKLFKRPL